jgi:hypothetical protein
MMLVLATLDSAKAPPPVYFANYAPGTVDSPQR